ncbi:MAG: twin-arginine translocase TatA/TatE family subunit [Acidimicrobiia bacterium]
MFDLGPEKILMILAVACMFLGPTELPKAARKIGAVRGQLRSWQDALRAEVSSALALDVDASRDGERTVPSTVAAPEPVPEGGDSFN